MGLESGVKRTAPSASGGSSPLPFWLKRNSLTFFVILTKRQLQSSVTMRSQCPSGGKSFELKCRETAYVSPMPFSLLIVNPPKTNAKGYGL